MSRHDNDLPGIVSICACDPGWRATYKGENGTTFEEPVAAWGILAETSDGFRVRHAVALVPEGFGTLSPAGDAQNFDQIVYRHDALARDLGEQRCVAHLLIANLKMGLWHLAQGSISEDDLSAMHSSLDELKALIGSVD